VLRKLQQSLDETIGHPRRNTGYAGSNNSSARLLPESPTSTPLSAPTCLPLSPSVCPPPSLLRTIPSLSFFSPQLFTGCLFPFATVSPGFHALFISTVIADNVVEPENNIGVVAPLYCDIVTMYLHRFGGVTIVESGVIVNAMIKTVMVTIAEIVWHCCASLIRIYVALSKLGAVIYVSYISMTLHPRVMSDIIIATAEHDNRNNAYIKTLPNVVSLKSGFAWGSVRIGIIMQSIYVTHTHTHARARAHTYCDTKYCNGPERDQKLRSKIRDFTPRINIV